MISNNKYHIKGRFMSNPDLRENANGTKFCMFTLAVKTFPVIAGKINYNAYDPINFKIWGKLAERLCKEGRKGDRVWVEGAVESYKEKQPDGTEKLVMICGVQDFEILKLSANIGDDCGGVFKKEDDLPPVFSPDEFDDYTPNFDV